MKRLLVGVFTTLFIAAQFLGTVAFASSEDLIAVKEDVSISDAYVPDEILVGFKNDNKPFHTIKVPQGQVKQFIKAYENNPNVLYAEPNYYAKAFVDDPYYQYQWNLGTESTGGINAENAWTISTGAGVTVAVLDTGVAYENYDRYKIAPDLRQTSFIHGYDFINNDSHANDDNGHGTHVAGTIAQSTDNGVGVAGVAYDATIMPVKVLNSSGSGSYQAIANGIYFAVDNGAQVINMSLGGPSSSQTLLNALIYAQDNGVTVVAATGNDDHGPVSYPAAYDSYVIGVGATRYDKDLAYYSNVGPEVDLVAPGGDVTVDQNGDGYGDGILQQTLANGNVRRFGYYFYQGTSMATPHVAGAAALLISNGNATTPADIEQALSDTALDLGATGFDNSYGYGLIDAYAALQWNGGTPPPPPPDNDPPVANPQSVNTNEDTALPITLTGSDPEGLAVTYAIASQPAHGSLSGTAPNVTYTPDANYNGDDSFTFTVNDGVQDSLPATVSITIIAVNDAPTVEAISTSTYVDTAVDIPLLGDDVDGDTLTYSVVSGTVVGGSVVVNGSTATFTPTTGSTDTGSFDYVANDGTVNSSAATVTISVTPAPEELNITVGISYDLYTSGRRDTFLEGTATVTVLDDGVPYTTSPAAVSGYWTHAPDRLYTEATNSSGEAIFTLKKVKQASVTFIVTEVIIDGITYPNP